MVPARRGLPGPLPRAFVLALSMGALVAVEPRLAFARDQSAPPATWRDDVSARPPAPGERALEGRLLPPCCYTQTLDVHESAAARDLRLEIRRRLYAGESVEAVEQSLVDQYGERLRAIPARDPMQVVAAAVLLIAGLAGVFVLQLRIRCADPLMVLTSRRAYIGRHDGDAIEVGGAGEGVEDEWGDRAGLL